MSDYEEEKPSEQKLVQLRNLVAQLAQADAEVEFLEEQLKAAAARARRLRENDVPELMESVGLKELSTTDDLHVTLRKEVRATWPKAGTSARAEAVKWLEAHKHGDLIKHMATVRFGKTPEDQELHQKYLAVLRKHLPRVHARLAEDEVVHPQTLCAFLREQLAEGTATELMDIVGAFEQKYAHIK